MQARYTAENGGHFGLAAKYYCHFTSPIRRYPDLEIHRMIKKMLHGELDEKASVYYRRKMPDWAKHCSKQERVAEDAERDTDALKKVEFMEDKVGQIYEGIISGPFIGTDFTGNTYPGAQAPFGMVQLSPDNGLPGWDRISGYFYPDSTIAGFSHTHLSGTGAGDLYDISFMPVTLPYKEADAPLGIHSLFSHDEETASAGYYQVRLKDYNINVELTATERCGI